MNLIVAAIQTARTSLKSAPAQALATDFLARAERYIPCSTQSFSNEAALLASVAAKSGRTTPYLILLDPHGKALTSDAFAAHLGTLRDSGVQTVIFAIGPPDGWSATARARAGAVLSFGPITLPHELARVVLAEQIYRALTILAGHPYHCGH